MCLLCNFYVTVYVPDYVTVICVLGSGTNEGSSPRSGHGRPPSLVPTVINSFCPFIILFSNICRCGVGLRL